MRVYQASVHRLVKQLVKLAKREHYNCEDNWYGCPLSFGGCSDDDVKGCNCGAESHNIKVDMLAIELDALLAKLLKE